MKSNPIQPIQSYSASLLLDQETQTTKVSHPPSIAARPLTSARQVYTQRTVFASAPGPPAAPAHVSQPHHRAHPAIEFPPEHHPGYIEGHRLPEPASGRFHLRTSPSRIRLGSSFRPSLGIERN